MKVARWAVCLSLAAYAATAAAQEVVIRDSIGPTSLCTDGCANYPNDWDPTGFAFAASQLTATDSGGLLKTIEIIVGDANLDGPTNPTSYLWHVSIWQDEFGVESFPLAGDVLSVELKKSEVTGIEWGHTIVGPMGKRATYKISADLSTYGVNLAPSQHVYVALYPVSVTPPFFESTGICESAELSPSDDLYRFGSGIAPFSDGANNQYTGRAAVRATIIAPGGGVDVTPCGVESVPAVSEWGIVVLVLLLLTTGGIAFRRVAA